LGRRRPVPGLNEKSQLARSNAERIAVNTPIQGTSADMIKLAMIRVARDLPRVAPGARMVCQVHDELVFSVPGKSLEPAGEAIRRAMTGAMKLEVPVEVEVTHGANWAEC
jgi:DNA polymerase I